MSFIKVTDPRKREELIKDFIETRKRIKDNFIARKVGEAEYQTGLSKLFKPVTETQKETAKEITDAQKATAKEITEAQKETAERIEKGLLPIREGIEGLTMLTIKTGDPIPAIEYTEEEKTVLGDLAVDGLTRTHGRKATQSDLIPVDPKKRLYRIGKTPITIKNNDLYIEDLDKINGTAGLWELLTSQGIPNKTEYKPFDLFNYTLIMHFTNATRQDFNKDNKLIGGKNEKMNKLIKPFVIALKNNKIKEKIIKYFEEDKPTPGTSKAKGYGLKFLSSDPNALIDRFDLLFSSKKAGHTGVRNEIISILDELKRQKVININEYKKLNSLIKKW